MSSSSRFPLSARQGYLPDEVARREFASVFRGYDPAEVRTFLKQLSEQQSEQADLIAQLQQLLMEMEDKVKNPELDEETVTKLLGEQTAQILRSAREAARDSKARAEQEVSKQLREAHEATEKMRQEAEALLARRADEAERMADEIRNEAEQFSIRLRANVEEEMRRLRAETEAEMLALRQQTQSDLVDERSRARQQARELIDTARSESRALVERMNERQNEMLDTLIRKRKIAVGQVEQLRAGRQRLLKAYMMVRGTLDEVTNELQHVEEEARQAAQLAAVRSAQANDIQPAQLDSVVEIEAFELDDDVSAEIIQQLESSTDVQQGEIARGSGDESDGTDDSGEDGSGDGQEGGPAEDDRLIDLTAETASGEEIHEAELLPMSGDSGGSKASGGTKGSADTKSSGGAAAVEVADADVMAVESGGTATATRTDTTAKSSVSTGLIIGEAFAGTTSEETDRALKLRRDAVLGKFRAQAVRRLRRVMQDEQDALVARIRSGKGKDVASLLGSPDEQAATYHRSVVKLFREVVRTGASSVEGSTGVERGVIDHAGTAAARGLAIELVRDLRGQLEPVVRDLVRIRPTPEATELHERIGDPYRAIRGEFVEQLVDDRIGGMFDQGVSIARS